MTVPLALAFAAGVALLQAQAALGPDWLWPASVAAALGLLLVTWGRTRAPAGSGGGRITVWPRFARRAGWRDGPRGVGLAAAWMAVAFALGHGWADFRAERRLAEALPPELELRDLDLTGTVAGLPLATAGFGAEGLRFEFIVETAALDGRPVTVPRRLALAWYGSRRKGASGEVPALAPGERWQLRARLRRPHARLNPHGPDADYRLLEQGLRASGSVRNADGANRRLPGSGDYAGLTIDRLRYAIDAHIGRALAGARHAGVIAALVTGEQRGIWRVTNNS
ncbi:ComEC/Rec2 family competence protein [Derxia gummosa]|uniref:ComEC/Rec2 family competence protein n=1 Tax=Derxia gummosa DSM 723 TaxID=1121388 RepID=A0A8B6X6K3_9BURK|nr:ComEC/Rec2 family competence protein [Derxia gummosa]